MCFKAAKSFWPAAIAATLSGLMVVLVGCAGEDAPNKPLRKIQMAGSKCLGEVPSRIDDFFKGKSTDAETAAVWDCFDYALNMVGKYYEGESSAELSNFLERYFLDGKKLAPEFVAEFMALKRLFVGGSEKSITARELKAVRKVNAAFKEAFRDLRPHISVLLVLDSQHIVTGEEFTAAETALRKAAQNIFRQLERGAVPYDIARLGVFIEELSKFVAQSRPDNKIAELKKYVPPLAQAKALLLNTSPKTVQPTEWKPLGEVFARAAAIGLRAYYGFHDLHGLVFTENELAATQRVMQQGRELVMFALSKRTDGVLPIADLNPFLDELNKLKILGDKISTQQLQGLVAWFLNRVMRVDEADKAEGLTLARYDFLMNEVQSWSAVQLALLRDPQFKQFHGDSPEMQQMAAILDVPGGLSLDAKGRVISPSADGGTDASAASRLNLERGLFRLVFRAYQDLSGEGLESYRHNPQVTKDTLGKAYAAIEPVLVVLDLAEAGDATRYKKIFRDANLFMSRSNGDDNLSLFEAVEYIHFVFGGIEAGHVVTDSLPSECQVGGPTSQTATAIRIDCFREALPARAVEYFSHLPRFLAFGQGLSPEAWRRNLRYLEIACRDGGASDEPIQKSDIYEMFVFLHYIENIMTRFDRDHTKELETAEVIEAYGLVQNVLGELVSIDPKKDRNELLSLFTYLLHFGKVPDQTDPETILQYPHWKWQVPHWELHIDRSQVLVVLANLTTM